jgi:acyl carrier protein
MQMTDRMQAADIEREIRKFLVENFLFGRADELRDHVSLLGNVVDSTGAIELVSFLQERFAITIEDNEVVPENFDSLTNVTAYVERKLREEARARMDSNKK